MSADFGANCVFEQLIDLVRELPLLSLGTPRALPEGLSQRLRLMAGRLGGVVPKCGGGEGNKRREFTDGECDNGQDPPPRSLAQMAHL